MACAMCLAAELTCVARLDPSLDPVDLEAVKTASLVPVCAYMKQQKPHIRDWKKGELPTEKELKTLIRRHPDLEKELLRIRTEFYREIETNEQKRNQFRVKRRKRKSR